MSQHVEDPSKQTDHAARNLGTIIQKAGTTVVEHDKKLLAHEEGRRREAGAELESGRAQGNVEAGLYGDIAMEGLGGAVGSLMKVAKDTLTVTEDRGWFSDAAKPSSAFPITDRVKNVSKFFSGKSDADDEEYKPKTNGIEGKESYQEVQVSRMLNKQKYDHAMRLQQEYMAEQAYMQRMGMRGPAMGGMTMGMGMMPGLNLGMTPKAPNFNNQSEEAPTNWGAGNITG
jgi:hypothetical protein